MGQGLDLQGMHVVSNKLTPAAPKPAVFHVLAPDMNAEILGGATHLVANGASFISLPEPTQDCQAQLYLYSLQGSILSVDINLHKW